MNCKEIAELLYDYAEGELEADVSEKLEKHLSDCPPCTTFIKTYKATGAISKNLRCEEIPPELQEKLRSFN